VSMVEPRPSIASLANPILSSPSDTRAENLMCYIDHEGTYTPAHKEMCASLGHNIMVTSVRLHDMFVISGSR
jgi:hypothetical protein